MDARTYARKDRPHSTIPHELVKWGIRIRIFWEIYLREISEYSENIFRKIVIEAA